MTGSFRRPLVLGHRGAPRVAPENTLASFDAALARGADGVELDVRLSATGALVVCHDASLGRVAHADVRVRAASPWALARYDLGGGATVPTLREVFERMKGRVVNVEVKADDGDPVALAIATAGTVRTSGRGVDVIVSSFEPAVLMELLRIAPEIRRGLLVSDHPLEAADLLARGVRARPHAIHPHHALCTPERVRLWHAGGYAVHAWTVDSAADKQRVAEAGVEMMITNEPG